VANRSGLAHVPRPARQPASPPKKGIITPWPKAGLKILWHTEVGPGYGHAHHQQGASSTTSTGKPKKDGAGEKQDGPPHQLGRQKTGASLWTYEYPSVYKDQFGYKQRPPC